MSSTPPTPGLSIALKEWDLQINALLAGTQPFLLRKGGILEAENQFVLEHPRFLFFPTFIHQDPRMVKPQYREGLRQERAEPAALAIKGYGEVAGIFEVPSRAKLETLMDLYLWEAPLLDMRFAYRPEKPLYLVLVRAFSFARPSIIPNTLHYAGCKSWVPLEEKIILDDAKIAMPEEALQQISRRVSRAFC